MTGRFSGFRTGALAVPMYLFFVGAGHIWLSGVMTSQFEKVPRDGQAFLELFVLGVLSILTGVVMAFVVSGCERGAVALLRAAVVGLAVAGAVVAYTSSRGVERGGVVGVSPCIVEQGREVCVQGDGTYIKSSRPDVPVMFLGGTLFAYGAAHFLGRLRRTD